ncbi:MAG: S8 family serine peptidase [Alphaproteobacteria bacterium]
MKKITQQEFDTKRSSFKKIHDCDLSDISISPEIMTGPTSFEDTGIIVSWTDNVVWPTDIIEKINPQQMLEKAKQPTEMKSVHSIGKTGKNIGIAIIDQRLYREHPEYADRIKHYEAVGTWPENDTTTPDYHGSLVVGCAAGKTTGTAPDADIYYFAANNWVIKNPFLKAIEILKRKEIYHRKYQNMAIRRILEINKTLPENKKIRFLSCSWGRYNDLFVKESNELFAECERNGIMVLGGFYKHTLNSICRYDKRFGVDETNPWLKNKIGIPTDGKTTPYFKGGYYYTRLGGASSTNPYLAGIFACALQDNTIFFTRPNWQDELIEIMQQTATEHPLGGKIINPSGIENRVSEIARAMEQNLLKQQASQHE